MKKASKILTTIFALFGMLCILNTHVSANSEHDVHYVAGGYWNYIGYSQGKESNSIGNISIKFENLVRKVSGEYYWGAGSPEKTKKALANMTKHLPFDTTSFKANKKDMHHYIDMYHLSYKDYNEINTFTAKLINNARKHLIKTEQVPRVIPSVRVYKFAQDVNKEYAKDKWTSLDIGHDIKGINRAAKKWHLSYDKTEQVQYYEDTSTDTRLTPTLYSHISMAAMKAVIYNILYDLVFKDNMYSDFYWGHTIDILGFNDETSGKVGIATTIDWYGTMHITRVPMSKFKR